VEQGRIFATTLHRIERSNIPRGCLLHIHESEITEQTLAKILRGHRMSGAREPPQSEGADYAASSTPFELPLEAGAIRWLCFLFWGCLSLRSSEVLF